MHLPVMPPVKPMLAKATKSMPHQSDHPAGFLYEPKWDGFRCVVFRDGDEVELGSRNERPLTRYFPEVVAAVKESLPPRCVVDGEIVIATPGGLDFEALQQRIHPAASRINRLAGETPASLVAFDLLALGDADLRGRALEQRRALLEEAMAGATPPVHLTPVTTDEATATDWFERFEGAGLDGVVAKPRDVTYREDERVMLKVKHSRTADVVLAGFRWHKSGPIVGSLLLGLYDDDGALHHVGVAASFTMQRRKELVDELAPLREGALEGHPWEAWATASNEGQMPGNVSRWNAKKDLSWEPLRIERVLEVTYEHMEGSRFRHTAHFLRWRPDKTPEQCTYEQLEVVAPYELSSIFGV
ncbi:MAG TPA: ATP-dependent DNA ligase [Frankiaceae bacterium]|jgi:ATP-dependent DNA ligase|nr:ATP-dependent DNA ligase [Frankiaceae bacterium]